MDTFLIDTFLVRLLMQHARNHSVHPDASDRANGDTNVFGGARVGCIQRARHQASRVLRIFQERVVSSRSSESALHFGDADRVYFDIDRSPVLTRRTTFRQHVGWSLVARNFRFAQRGDVSSTRQDLDSDRCLAVLHARVFDRLRSTRRFLAGVHFHDSRGGLYCRRGTSRTLKISNT